MELSEEMQEALRILREDGQVKAYREMTDSNRNLVSRLDDMETRNSERDAEWEKRFGGAEGAKVEEESVGDVGGTPGDGKGDPDGSRKTGIPDPPPVKEEQPAAEDEKPRRRRWHESDVYSRD